MKLEVIVYPLVSFQPSSEYGIHVCLNTHFQSFKNFEHFLNHAEDTWKKEKKF